MKTKTANSRRLDILGNGDRSSDQEIFTTILKQWWQKLGYCSIFAAVPAMLVSQVQRAQADEATKPEVSVAGRTTRLLDRLNKNRSNPALLKRQSKFLLPHQKGNFALLAALGGNDDCPGRAIAGGNYTPAAPYIDSGDTTGANDTVTSLFSYYYSSYDAHGPDHVYSFTLTGRGPNPQIEVSTTSGTYRPLIYILDGRNSGCPAGTGNFASNWLALSDSRGTTGSTATLNDGQMNNLPLNVPLHLFVDSALNDAGGAGPYTIRMQDVTIVGPTPGPNAVQFSSANYSVSEGSPRVDITLSRSGDTTSAASVGYATIDDAGLQNCNVKNGIASPRCDYENTIGTLTFAAGETSKSFSVAIIDDSYAEGNETFRVALNNPSGATLGTPSMATVTIIDNDTVDGPNPIDQTNFFVRQQYLDFLGREPDPPGFTGWVDTINNCSTDHPGHPEECDRIHVSAAFFQSREFQERGYFAYRFYSVGFGRKPDYAEFVPDLARVSGFLTNDQLEAAKTAFVNDFMSRPAFVNQYSSLDNVAYVDALINTAGVNLSSRQTLIDSLNNNTATRAQVLREIVESTDVSTKYFNQAFVVMEYFGYLRRDPDALYLDWITVLDQTADPRGMVNGFVNSAEYRQRFGP